jgi:hypothetical protein
MPELLASRVYLYPKVGRFPTEVAQLALTADNNIRLTAGNAVVFDEPLTDLRVSGAGSSLTFTTANDRRRVDFSPYSAAQRIVTTDDADQEIFMKADAETWRRNSPSLDTRPATGAIRNGACCSRPSAASSWCLQSGSLPAALFSRRGR